MKQTKLAAVLATVSVCVFGCSAGTESAGDELSGDGIVSLEDDGLEVQTEGVSYNGWTQSVSGWHQYVGSGTYNVDWTHSLTRYWGNSTRGGGACVVRYHGASCSNDTPCITAAQALHGTSAHGYCYASKCYIRPGPQSNLCTLNPNRSSGTLAGTDQISHHAVYILGCMTKAAGPNTACGCTSTTTYWLGANEYACGASYTDLYMRTVQASTLFTEE